MYERLSRLVDAGYLRCVRLPASTSSGSGPTFYTLGARSYPLLKERLGLVQSDLKRLRHAIVPSWWEHETQVRDFRLTLELACEQAQHLELSEWITDDSLRRAPFKITLDDETVHELVPDGIFTLALDDSRSKRCYLEIDRGTHQSPIAFRRKVNAYFTLIGAQPTPVLYVVPDEARRTKIAGWITAEALSCSGNPKLFAVALRADISEAMILQAPIWQVVSGPTLALLPVAQEQEQPPGAPTHSAWQAAVVTEGGGTWSLS